MQAHQCLLLDEAHHLALVSCASRTVRFFSLSSALSAQTEDELWHLCVCAAGCSLQQWLPGASSPPPQGLKGTKTGAALRQRRRLHKLHTPGQRAVPSGALLPFTKAAVMEDEEDQDPRTSLHQLIATLIARKGASRRNSVLTSRASGPAASHRIKDRDYMGWMDFGRRSAEEYEYSS
ncbi:hypothetical protein AALO_G00184980 [Alosa alosa]|uniref:Gastrin/cholecystokinin peptide hormone domain-containing protein n=1 Tax=Alosa alosa TaxID=278164 RepID=A0AAV6G9Q6_9TELE|nr:hypothetical protein AALO_G00184980 [Alosa alosa]